MAKSKLVANRNQKKATILASKRTVEDAIRRADALGATWMKTNPDDPRLDELQRVVDHLGSLLKKTPQQMSVDGMSTIEDYFDDAKAPEVANTIKREVNMIAKWLDESRTQNAQPAEITPEQQGVGYVPDSAKSVMSSKEEKDMADKKANGAGFVSDRDEKGEAKAPTQLTVPRLAKKKKEAVPEEPTPAAPIPAADAAPAAAAPAPTPAAPAGGGSVNPIDYIPTETLIKVIEDLPKEDDFAQNTGKQDALIELTNILKGRPIMPPEPVAGEAAAPAAPLPVAASKKADYGDHAIGNSGTVNSGSGASSQIGQGGGNTPAPEQISTNPSPEKAKVDLGGLSIASSLEDEKTADDYRIHDFKLQDEGIVPQGKLPNMDEQESQMHPEEEHEAGTENPFAAATAAIDKGDKLTAVKAAIAAVNTILASGAAGGWSTDVNEKGNIVEDGGNLPEVGEAHGMRDEAPAKLDRPATTAPMKLAAEVSTSKAVKQSESLGNDLKKMYLDAKTLTTVNDTRAVREAVEAIFRAADMFDEATKTLNKQLQQEESEAAAQEIKAKNKKSSYAGLALAAAE